MTSEPTHLSWFLLESESEKIYKAICNYLSLGQFDPARALLRVHFEREGKTADDSDVVRLLLCLIEFGPPESWICSSSVPSTSHLLSMCVDMVTELGGEISSVLKKRCEFDLMLALVYLEEGNGSYSTRIATELRSRYAVRLVSEPGRTAGITLPRILISSGSAFCVLPALSVPFSMDRHDHQFTGDINACIFAMCKSSRQTSVGLIQLLHTISPVSSAQLTHIQAALVADSLASAEWKGVCTQLRFLNELGQPDVLVNSPLLTDLMSLLVTVMNGRPFLIQQKNLISQISKFVDDCLSTSHGVFPFVAKKRRPLFAFSNIFDDQYLPNELLRLSLYEALSTLPEKVAKSLIHVVSELEDSLLSLHCEKALIPPCFSDQNPIPFWDSYLDFARVAKVHALKYPLETAVNLVRRREFDLTVALLRNFNQLKPLTIFVCWNDFGVDIESRSRLLDSVWRSYLDDGQTRCPQSVENAVWSLAYRFHASMLSAKYHKNSLNAIQDVWLPISGDSESVIDIMRKLPSHSLLYVLRAVLVSLGSPVLVPSLSALPLASRVGCRTAESEEVSFDLDVTRTYFAFRRVIALVSEQVSSGKLEESVREVESLCHGIERVGVRLILLDKILSTCFTTSALLKRKSSAYIVDLKVLVSLVCLVCAEAMEISEEVSRDIREASQELLVKILISLRESVRLAKERQTTPLRTVADWAGVVGADSEVAIRCDLVLTGLIPLVQYVPEDVEKFTTPPRANMALIADKFVPRLTEGDWVSRALMLNDYELAERLVKFFKSDKNKQITSKLKTAKAFAGFRQKLRAGQTTSPKSSSSDPLMAIDLAVSGSVAADTALGLLHRAHRALSAEAASAEATQLVAWASKMAVLLEAKTEFRSNVSGSKDTASVVLAEIILGIETLPNEPELLKDHLNRMHTQRSAIMSLVDRVDQVKHGKVVNAEGEIEDFLSDAIRTLTSEGVEGLVGSQGGTSFLIQFLEYLSRVCSLVQESVALSSTGIGAKQTSLFDILSEQPEDLVARIIFLLGGYSQAAELCQLMHLDLIGIVENQSKRLGPDSVLGAYYISPEIVDRICSVETAWIGDGIPIRSILLCVERRSQRWPSEELLQYGIRQCGSKGPVLGKWIEERLSCWRKFVYSYNALTGIDARDGFTIEEEIALSDEFKQALSSVATDSQEAMNSLTRKVAKAFMKTGEFISALKALDDRLAVTDRQSDKELRKEALMGCVTVCSHALTPQQIYQLLWRVEDVDELLTLTKQFYPRWSRDVAVRSLRLCEERLSLAGESRQTELAQVTHIIKVIATMDSVVAATSKWTSWQTLEAMDNAEDCVQVITDLISANEHSIAVEFVGLKSKVLQGEMDRLSDKIELSRLRYIFLTKRNTGELLQRLQEFHHPLKASSLSMHLLASIESVRDRIRLGELLQSHGIACEEDAEGLETQLATLALFAVTDSQNIREEWKPLLFRPDLVMESLLLNGKTKGIENFLREFRSWRNDDMLLSLAKRAIGLQSPLSDPQSPRCRDIGLGGRWSLTGIDSVDARTRANHGFEKRPNMPLALELLSIVCRETESNAETIFKFSDELSLFLFEFLPGRPSGESKKCPFGILPFLRQAVVSLLLLLKTRFAPLALPESLRVAVAHGMDNITLISDLYVKCGIRVGLADISDPSHQARLRDELIAADALDLAERVCFASGDSSEQAKRSADVVTMHRAVLLIKINEFEKARTLIDSRLNFKKLSGDQLSLLEEALKSRSCAVALEDLKSVHRILIERSLDKSLNAKCSEPRMGYLPMDRDMTESVRPLLPPSMLDERTIPCNVVLSQIVDRKTNLGAEFSGTTTPTKCSDDELDVVIQTPHVVHPVSPLKSMIAKKSKLKDSDLQELLYYCDKHGGPGAAINVLMKDALVDAAFARSLESKLNEKIFVASIASAIAVSPDVSWRDVLNAIRRSKEPPWVVMPYVSAIESHLRQTACFQYLYDFEVSMGREAQAGIVAVQLYLRAERSWEERMGWLETARRHLDSASSHRFARRFRQKRRTRLQQPVPGQKEVEHISMNSSSSDEDEPERIALELPRIQIPFNLPSSEVIQESIVNQARALADLQLQVCGLMPQIPPSASLFGSVQSVSELIDYLLMDGHVTLAKTIVGRVKLPDSALCGIFDVITY